MLGKCHNVPITNISVHGEHFYLFTDLHYYLPNKICLVRSEKK